MSSNSSRPTTSDLKGLAEPIRADERYLKVQPLTKQLVRALANRERVYVSGKPHRIKSMGISESGQIMGKLEPVEPSKSN